MIKPVQNTTFKLPVISTVKMHNFPVKNYAKQDEFISCEKNFLYPVEMETNGKITHVSFKGNFQNPEKPAIQFKVRGVSRHQNTSSSKKARPIDNNIVELADSEWYDGKPLSFKLDNTAENSQIDLYDEDFGCIGRVPNEAAIFLSDLIEENPDDYKFTLSNVIAGTSKGAPTIGLRANLICISQDKKVCQNAKKVFDELLNSNNPDLTECIMQYQEEITPSEVLTRIFNTTKENDGEEAVKKTKKAIDKICDEIDNAENKNILLIGHSTPDGDTIGCVLGMHAAIKSKYPQKNVDCTIDDKIPGLYREKLPNIDIIKLPYSQERIESLKDNIEFIKTLPHSKENKFKVKAFKEEIEKLSDESNYFDAGVLNGESPKKYNLVILMDIPSPSRFSKEFKPYLEQADKVIYIDHHPLQYDGWDILKEDTGVDLDKISSDKLLLTLPRVPAAAELISVIADKAGMLNSLFKNTQLAKQYVAGIVSGISSDTGSFARTANYTPEDMKLSVAQRPNFAPEGLSKYLIKELGNSINKKWLRENIVYDISDKSNTITEKSPREKMISCAMASRKIFPKIGLGLISMSYDDLFDIWSGAKKADSSTTFSDVQNSIKYSEVMNSLRESPKYTNHSGISSYSSPYEDDKIAILLLQDKKKGEIDEDSKVSDVNSIRVSLRSQEGSNYAEILSYLFNGGGHASAAGGRIESPTITVNSKIGIKLDGKLQTNPYKICRALYENYEIKHDSAINERDKSALLHTFEMFELPKGKTIQAFIADVVEVMRDYSCY